jgi:hypothetical protein
LLQKQMASNAIRDLCGLLSKAQGFLDQPLVIGMTLLHGGSSACEETTGRKEQLAPWPVPAAGRELLTQGFTKYFFLISDLHPG